MSDKPIYIHYGSDKFTVPNPIRNRSHFNKPRGGMWASRKDAAFGWIDFCKNEEFGLDRLGTSFEFTLKDGARILVLENIDQLDILPKNVDAPKYIKGSQWSDCCLDFEKLSKEYNAIELPCEAPFHWALYGWDCDCILIMNPDIVELIPVNA